MKTLARTMASLLAAAVLWGGLAAAKAAADGPDLSGVWKSKPNFRAKQGETWTLEAAGAGYRFSVAELALSGTITQAGNGLRITFDNERVIGGDGQVETDLATGQAVRMIFGINTLTRQGAAPGGTPPPPVNPDPSPNHPPVTFGPAIGPPPPLPPMTFGPAIGAPPPSPPMTFGPAIGPPPPPIDEPPIDEPPIDEPLPPPPYVAPPHLPPPQNPPPRPPPFVLPPLPTVLFGATDPDAVVKGRYFLVKPDGSLGELLGTFEVRGDVFKMFPAGGDEIQVGTDDAPKDGVLATDYAHYATPPIDPLETERDANGRLRIGPGREHTPHNFMSRSSGTLNFMLGGSTLDADMQQKYVTVATDGPTDLAQTAERPTKPVRIRFIPD